MAGQLYDPAAVSLRGDYDGRHTKDFEKFEKESHRMEDEG